MIQCKMIRHIQKSSNLTLIINYLCSQISSPNHHILSCISIQKMILQVAHWKHPISQDSKMNLYRLVSRLFESLKTLEFLMRNSASSIISISNSLQMRMHHSIINLELSVKKNYGKIYIGVIRSTFLLNSE